MQRVERLETGRFDWDENKRVSNIRKSGVDFLDAAAGLLLPHLETPSDKHEEARTKAICQISEPHRCCDLYDARRRLQDHLGLASGQK